MGTMVGVTSVFGMAAASHVLRELLAKPTGFAENSSPQV